jgi:hypothetical protein
LPASTLVVLVTLFATYYWLGFIAGNAVANDAKWTTVFAANIHFGLIGTDYLGAQLPLQHIWSLGVWKSPEKQGKHTPSASTLCRRQIRISRPQPGLCLPKAG